MSMIVMIMMGWDENGKNESQRPWSISQGQVGGNCEYVVSREGSTIQKSSHEEIKQQIILNVPLTCICGVLIVLLSRCPVVHCLILSLLLNQPAELILKYPSETEEATQLSKSGLTELS